MKNNRFEKNKTEMIILRFKIIKLSEESEELW